MNPLNSISVNIVSTLAAMVCAVTFVSAQDMGLVTRDLKDAQQRLTTERERIAAEKPELAKKFDLTRASLIEKRRKVRIARMAKEHRATMLKELKKKHYRSAQDFTYTDGQLKDYGLMMETFLLPGEEKSYQNALDGIHLADGGGGSKVERMKDRLAILDAGLTRLEKLVGGSSIQADAVAPDGEVKSGTFLVAGPAVWFISDDKSLAGSVVREKGTLSPRVRPGDLAEIQTVAAGGEAALSIDVTGGKALALASLESDPLDIFRKGGFWIWPILGIALISAIAGVMKFIQIIRIRTPQNDWVASILAAMREGDVEEAKAIASKAVHPVSAVMTQCIGYAKAGPDVAEEVLYEQLIGVQNKLQGGLPFIAITAATAPLLGLLGTVAGMIRTFNVITVSGTGDAKPLAGGISEALITTLFGLVVAIPALIIHALLSRRSQGIIQNTEKLGLTFVNGLRGDETLNSKIVNQSTSQPIN